ncbi:MAG: hypothetical protein PHX01_05500 [Clostridia bacterium]|jgi:hypothetical protein|nr:hypothetical protein [Clostridia bacterium]
MGLWDRLKGRVNDFSQVKKEMVIQLPYGLKEAMLANRIPDYGLDKRYKSCAENITDMLGCANSLPVTGEGFYGIDEELERAHGPEVRSYQQVLQNIGWGFNGKISNMEFNLKVLSGLDKFDSFYLQSEEGQFRSVNIPETKRKMSEEIIRAKAMKEELEYYAELSFRIKEKYICSLAKGAKTDFRPTFPQEFTENDFDKLVEFHLKYGIPGRRGTYSYDFKNIAEIRRQLGMPESSRLNELVAMRREEREKNRNYPIAIDKPKETVSEQASSAKVEPMATADAPVADNASQSKSIQSYLHEAQRERWNLIKENKRAKVREQIETGRDRH